MNTIDRTGCPGRGKHGTVSAYQKRGCTCPDARQAAYLYHTRRRHGRLQPGYRNATGTRRRLEALGALGWTSREIGIRMGRPAGTARALVASWRHPLHDVVYSRTADEVTKVYEQLSGTAGPSKSARIRAARQGWAPPLAWEGVNIDDPRARPVYSGPRTGLPDEVLIERVMSGGAPLDSLPPRHRTIVIDRLTERGWSAQRIAEWVQTAERTVTRYRAPTKLRAAVASPWAPADLGNTETEGLVA